MNNSPRYACPPPVRMSQRNWPDRVLTRSPIWCAVDLRDGNQALPVPLTPERKKRYFQLLVELGFKEIEVGFPSASADDFQFCRDLIEEKLIPDDVTISVLVQAREHLIARTMESLHGVRRAMVHVYTATSDLHMNYVFGKSAEQTAEMALAGVAMVRDAKAHLAGSEILLEFSPEEFTDTDLDFAVSICDRVVETWNPTPGEKVVLNLPATVERRMPNQYADLIEEFIRRQKHRDRCVISLHAHNDQGCAVAATELALLAGADRVEGTLFGHGERCGNVDLVTLCMNLQYMGIDTGIRFADIEAVRDELVELTSMPVNPRHPYAGELVFTAFSGSHQDAIHKGLAQTDELNRHFNGWKVPYLHIDPRDIGRSFEKFIRINSQSGKGGIAYVLRQEFGIKLPRRMAVDFSRHVQAYCDENACEVDATKLYALFRETYLRADGQVKLIKYWPRPDADDPSQIEGELHLTYNGVPYQLSAVGSGPISAFVHGLKQLPLPLSFALEEYEEEAIGQTADAEAITFVRLANEANAKRMAYGIGLGANIDQAAVRAVVSALNGLLGSVH